MNYTDREFHITRIISGNVFFMDDDKIYIFKHPSRFVRYGAETIYNSIIKSFAGISDEELETFLLENDIWDFNDQEILDGLNEDLDVLKIGLFENILNTNVFVNTKENILRLKNKILEYNNRKHSYDYLLCSQIAAKAKLRYIITHSTFNEYDEQIPPNEVPIDNILTENINVRLQESSIRELSRTEPWRSYWDSRTHAGLGLFGSAAVDLTEEQRTLISYSNFYDMIKQHPEAPSDDVIEDDDVLDGWLLKQNKERSIDKERNNVDKLITNSKIKNSDQIFIPINSIEDAKRLSKLNTPMGNMIKKQRNKKIMKEGIVNETHMPDTERKLEIQYNAARMQLGR